MRPIKHNPQTYLKRNTLPPKINLILDKPSSLLPLNNARQVPKNYLNTNKLTKLSIYPKKKKLIHEHSQAWMKPIFITVLII